MEGQSCYYLRWGRLRVEQVRQGRIRSSLEFEVSVRHPNGDIKQAVGYMGLEFKERSELEISIGSGQDLGDI